MSQTQKVIECNGRKITLIDSTDLSHFKSQEKTIEHDNLVFNEVFNANTDIENFSFTSFGFTLPKLMN